MSAVVSSDHRQNNFYRISILLFASILFVCDSFTDGRDFNYRDLRLLIRNNNRSSSIESENDDYDRLNERTRTVLSRSTSEDSITSLTTHSKEQEEQEEQKEQEKKKKKKKKVGKTTLESFDVEKISNARLEPNKENLKFIFIEGFIDREKLREILRDFPRALDSTTLANKKNVEKKDVVKTGQVRGAYKQLLNDVESDLFRDYVGSKLGISLKGWFNRVSLRGACDPNPCGGLDSIHVDHVAKAVSVLIYLNEDELDRTDFHGGDLLFLKSKKSLDDENVVARIPSYNGNIVAFRNFRNVKGQKEAIHGLREFRGLRRAVQVNWCKTKTCQ